MTLGAKGVSLRERTRGASQALRWSTTAQPRRLLFTRREVVRIAQLIDPHRLLLGPLANDPGMQVTGPSKPIAFSPRKTLTRSGDPGAPGRQAPYSFPWISMTPP